MPLSQEEKEFMLAQLRHDELASKAANGEEVDKDEMDDLEAQLFEARKAHRLVVQAQLSPMEGSSEIKETH